MIYFTVNPVAEAAQAFYSQGWAPMSNRFLWLTFGQAIGAAIAIAVLANAYRFGEPDFVSVCEYSFLVFAAIWALILWDIPTNLIAQIGILTIILSGIGMYILDRQAEAKYLHELAQAYGLNPEMVNGIHSKLGVPPLYA